MKKYLLIFFISVVTLSADDFDKILLDQEKKAEKLSDTKWFTKTLREKVSEAEKIDLSDIKERNAKILAESKPCFSGKVKEKYEIMVFASFSMPLTLWKEYSHALEKVGGAFVLQGLPEDSFETFAKALINLRENGVSAPVILNPNFFEKFEISTVPSIVCLEENTFDKIAGTVSIEYALETFSKNGETEISIEKLKKLKEKYL